MSLTASPSQLNGEQGSADPTDEVTFATFSTHALSHPWRVATGGSMFLPIRSKENLRHIIFKVPALQLLLFVQMQRLLQVPGHKLV